MENDYEPVIGLEIHAELKTKSKMFCSCVNGYGLEKEPNVNICPVCSGQPGTLPVINDEAVRMAIKTGLAVDCRIGDASKFDRKNYFYPDLPKGYQISQYDRPLAENGWLELDNGRRIGIRRIHLEEDTGKLIHPRGADYSLVDFNRAGVPLMELVTEPDIKSGEEARKFCQEFQLILRYLKVSDAEMEKGQMRCEVNISLKEKGSEKLGVKVEIKNLNSFRAVEKAVDYEINRQSEILVEGGEIVQETRGWDEAGGVTFPQRLKEEAHDYRYFSEPDLPPLIGLAALSEELKAAIPELPRQKRNRLRKEYGLTFFDAEILAADIDLGNYFERVASELGEWLKDAAPPFELTKAIKLAVNYLITELRKLLNQTGQAVADLKIKPEDFAEFVKIILQGVVSSSGAQILLKEMAASGVDPSAIVKEKDLAQVNDEEELSRLVAEVISQNGGPARDFKNGQKKALMFLVGKVMTASRGKANPSVAAALLTEMLK